MEKRKTDLKVYISDTQEKLSKGDFLNRAPKEVVEREEKKLAELESEYQKEIRAEYAGGNLDIENQGREVDSKEESLQLGLATKNWTNS